MGRQNSVHRMAHRYRHPKPSVKESAAPKKGTVPFFEGLIFYFEAAAVGDSGGYCFAVFVDGGLPALAL